MLRKIHHESSSFEPLFRLTIIVYDNNKKFFFFVFFFFTTCNSRSFYHSQKSSTPTIVPNRPKSADQIRQTPPDQNQQTTPPAAPTNGSIPIPTATQPAKPAKKVAIVISVRIVTLGMLSGLAFFLYQHRAKNSVNHRSLSEEGAQSNSKKIPEYHPRAFFTLEPWSLVGDRRVKPSPELQPLPPLAKPHSPTLDNSPTAMSSSSSSSSSDEESHGTAFYTS
ncbi:hypothetical protein PTKIN_Ptkin07bG0263200 [Pterospermum kingtungense]